MLDFGQIESHFRDFHQILGKTVMFEAKSHKLGKLQKVGKMESADFTLEYWILVRMNHIFRDFHQIPGKTVVFKAKIRKIWKVAKMGKWENAVFTLNYWILIRKNHIFVIFIKFWVRQSCLKQNSKNLESCKNGKNGKRRFHLQILDFDKNESHF